MIIQGKVATAIAYANVIEQEAIDQIHRMCDYDFTEGSTIRIMPDVHAGKGCTIGTTMTIRDKAVPNVVGVDIGCGMYTVKLNEREVYFARFDEAAHYVPSGMNVWEGCKEPFDLEALRCFRALKDTRRLLRSLGTLGGGNHFIEIDRAADGTLYLVIHTGSRNLGKQVAEYYQHLAVELNQGREEYFKKRDALIAEYKAAGRRKEIQAALKELHWANKPLTVPEDLCYVYGEYLDDYLHDVEICQQFARRNRELIAEVLLSRSGLTDGEAFHTIHNYIDTQEMILRKGAIAAHKDEKVLIPINMRDGWVDFATFLVEILNRRLAVRKRELREGVVFEHDHIARLVDERHDIARDERAAFALAHHDGRIFAGAHDDAWLGIAHNRDAVRTGQAIGCLAHRLEQIAVVCFFNQMSNDFGIGLAREHMSATNEFFFERGIVLDDAVMHYGDIVRAGRMRVRVILARFAVGCPTRMANAARAVDIHVLNHGLKAGDLANLVLHVEAQRRLHGDARRIVAAVFHALQAAN